MANVCEVVKIEKTVAVLKELSECLDLVALLVKDIKAKKPIAEIVADALPKLVTAIEGMDNIPCEIKDNDVVMTSAVYVAEIVESLLS